MPMEGSVLRLNLWKRIEVPAGQCPRIPAAFLDEERKIQGPSWFRQEYECSFEALEGLVYPDFARAVLPSPLAGEGSGVRGILPSPLAGEGSGVRGDLAGRKVGGIDFGFRNPFAALWGVVDRDG